MRAALFGVLIVLVLVQLVGAANEMRQDRAAYLSADRAVETKLASAALLEAAHQFAVERGVATVLLARDARPGDRQLAVLQEARAKADGASGEGMARLDRLEGREEWAGPAAALAARLAEVRALRTRIDAALALPPAARDPALAGVWTEAASGILPGMLNVLLAVNDPSRVAGGRLAAPLEQLSVVGLRLRDEAGRDGLRSNTLVIAGTPPSAAELEELRLSRARIDVYWRLARDVAAQLRDPGIDAAVAAADAAYFAAFREVRDGLLAPGAPVPGPADRARFTDAAVRGINALSDVVSATVARGRLEAETRRAAALSDLTGSAAALALSLVACAAALLIVQTRVVRPLVALTRAMRELADGRLDVAVPDTGARGEVGAMARTVEVFKRNANQLAEDNARHELAERLLRVERGVLEMTAARRPLGEALETLCRGIEEQVEGSRCAVLLVDPTGRKLHLAAAPSMPESFGRTVGEVAIEAQDTVCSMAVSRRETVVVADVTADPRLDRFHGLARELGLRACWSEPILTGDGTALGTFAIYHPAPEAPPDRELALTRRAGHLAAIAISSRRAEEQLEQAKAAAELGSRTKSEFLANMSHELRTPLNAIIGFAEVLEGELQQQRSPIASAGYAGDIIASGRHLLTLINDILDVSKMEAGKVELRERVCDVSELLVGCERIIRARAMERRLELSMELPPALPPVLVDDVKVKQIVLNLLSNAIKFTAPGGSVRMSARLTGDGGMALSVTDTGIGIRAEDIPKVFIPFHQVDNIYARVTPGTGLGLSLSKGLAELHGGTLVIDSTVGQGTTATLVLPAARVVASEGRGQRPVDPVLAIAALAGRD